MYWSKKSLQQCLPGALRLHLQDTEKLFQHWSPSRFRGVIHPTPRVDRAPIPPPSRPVVKGQSRLTSLKRVGEIRIVHPSMKLLQNTQPRRRKAHDTRQRRSRHLVTYGDHVVTIHQRILIGQRNLIAMRIGPGNRCYVIWLDWERWLVGYTTPVGVADLDLSHIHAPRAST